MIPEKIVLAAVVLPYHRMPCKSGMISITSNVLGMLGMLGMMLSILITSILHSKLFHQMKVHI